MKSKTLGDLSHLFHEISGIFTFTFTESDARLIIFYESFLELSPSFCFLSFRFISVQGNFIRFALVSLM